MDAMPPERLTGPTNELAKERNRAAAERTITAWIRNCLTLIGFGIAVDQLSEALQAGPWLAGPPFSEALAQGTALVFIVLGIGLLMMAIAQYRLEVKSIEREDYVLLSITRLNRFVVMAILAFGMMAGIAIALNL